jgi:hypothetical protein
VSHNNTKRQMGVLEFEADAGTAAGAAAAARGSTGGAGGGGGGVVFSDDEDEFGGELLQGSWQHYPPAAEQRWKLLGLDFSWLGRVFGSSCPPTAADTGWPPSSTLRRRRLWRCCRLLAALVAVGAFAALAVVLIKGGGENSSSSGAFLGGNENAARLPRARLPPPPAMAVGSPRQTPYCSWDSLQLPGAVRPVRYSLHLSAQLEDPYVVQGVARIALEAAENTPCVVLHAELDGQEAERAVAGAAAHARAAAAALAGGGGAAAAAAAAAKLPVMPPLARPWRAATGGKPSAEQGMRILSARLYFDGDALEEAAERRERERLTTTSGGDGDNAAASSSAWALPSPATSWPATPPPTFREGEDYVEGAVYNASSERGQVTLFFPRAVRSYPPSQKARAADEGKSLPRAMLELSFNYTLGTGLDGFYRSSWTGAFTPWRRDARLVWLLLPPGAAAARSPHAVAPSLNAHPPNPHPPKKKKPPKQTPRALPSRSPPRSSRPSPPAAPSPASTSRP